MAKRKKGKKRFKTHYHQELDNDGTQIKILEDTETGLSYLYVFGQGQGGLTVLLDEDGEPAVVPEI